MKGCWLSVSAAGPPEQGVASRYGTLSEELLPGSYVVSVMGRRVTGVEVRSGHETRVRVGVLRVAVGKGTSVSLFEPGADTAFHSFYGSADVLLPPGRVEVAVGGLRDAVDVREGEIIPF